MRCNYCERRCEINEGKTGFCRMYTVADGIIIERFPHRWSSCTVSLIESMPFYHVSPGSRCFTIGTASCNFRCSYCSNAYIAKEDPETNQELLFNLHPGELVAMVKRMNCRIIVFNVNEPTVSIPSLIEVSKEAKKNGIVMGCLTNGYMTEESADILASIFSFFNISLKGISDDFSTEYIGIKSQNPVLRNIRRLASDRYIEITTPVIQGGNDDEIDMISGFIENIDPLIPWHVFRLLPEDEMKDERYPDISSINNALTRARKKLPYLYFHNFVGSDWVNTLCPSCGSVVIERFSLGCGGDRLNKNHCVNGNCPSCGGRISLMDNRLPAVDTTGENS